MTVRPLRSSAPLPDPFREIRLLSLRTLNGANFWSSRPVTRLDLEAGLFDEIPSSALPGFTEALVDALPGLVEHRCNIGERGGFIQRLRTGTYAPHIVEHVALELQTMAGHDVGFGRARGGDRPGEYTVVMEHLHSGVGLRAAALALELVQRAFSRRPLETDGAVQELLELVREPDAPPISRQVFCGVTGGPETGYFAAELRRVGVSGSVVEMSPAYLLNAGLPYAASEIAVVLDADAHGVPDRYRERENADRLLSVVVEAVPRGGCIVVPANATGLQELIARDGRHVVTFDAGAEPAAAGPGDVSARLHGSTIIIRDRGESVPCGRLGEDVPAAVQLAARLVAHLRNENQPLPRKGHVEER